MNVVLHFQTPYATALACMESNNTNYFVIPEIPFYIGNIANIPYFTPGLKELAQAVTEKMQNHDMLLMRNHRQVTVAHDIDYVIQNAVFFELACEIILRS